MPLVDTGYPNFWVNFSEPGLNDPQYSLDGVDRSKWKMDEDGFAKATNAAILAARQQMQEQIRSIHQDIVQINHPVDYEVTVGGVPIDKAKFDG